MKDRIDIHIKNLDSAGIEASLMVFNNCFSFLSFSFEELSVEQLSAWIKQLENPILESIWERQKKTKLPSFILYYVMWHFRNKTLQEKSIAEKEMKDKKQQT